MALTENRPMCQYNHRLLELERTPEIRRPRLLLDSDEEIKALRGEGYYFISDKARMGIQLISEL